MLHLEKITQDELLHMMRASAMKLTDIRTQYLENVRAYHDIEFPAQEYTLRNSWTKVDVYDKYLLIDKIKIAFKNIIELNLMFE